jgi:hypothetical protein
MFGMVSTSFANSEQYPGTQQGTYVPEGAAATINGQIVKVGEKNQYLYNYPKLNLSVNPFAPMLGYFSGSVSYALSGNLALRGDISFGLGDDDIDSLHFGNSAAISAPIYFKKVYSGFFLEPGLRAGKFLGEDTAGFQVSVGWHWMFDSGLNVSVAYGLGRNLVDEDCYDYCYNTDIYPVGHFRVGYAF